MQGMMKNYKKIAMGTSTINKASGNLYHLDMNIKFIPSRVIVVIYKGYTTSEHYTHSMAALDTKQGTFGTDLSNSKSTIFHYQGGSTSIAVIQVHSLNKKRLTMYDQYGTLSKMTLDWIAIE